jgi:hypothetical protein
MTEHMKDKHPPTKGRKLPSLKMASYAGLTAGAIVFVCVLALLLFADPIVNKYVKPRIIKAFVKAYPAYSIRIANMNYSVLKNRFGFDSVALKAADGTFSGNMNSFTVSGICWMHLLWGGSLTPNDFGSSIVVAHDIGLNFQQSHYRLRCGLLRASVPASEMVTDSIRYYCVEDDEQFFAASQFRQTRFRFDVPQMKIAGLDYLTLLQENIYRAKSITTHDMFADILVNMDKPYDKNSSNPQMPNEALSSMKGIVNVGSVNIVNGRLKYCERVVVKGTPGVIAFNKVNVSVSGIANHTAHPDTAVIHADGLFMNSGTMTLFMAIPLTSTDFSIRYSGSLNTTDVTELNAFLEPMEHRRIKSGILQSATFDVNVIAGRASGALRVVYKDLSIAVLNKNTGSEKGIFNRISSLAGEAFVIRRTNMPNGKGSMKIGKIQYTRNPDDYFLQFAWFALRTGVQDVVGF